MATATIDTTSLLADRELVKAMIANLHVISYDGAKRIFDALADRANPDVPKAPNVVALEPITKILDVLPKFPADKPASTEYRYRAGPAVDQAWAILDAHVSSIIRA